MLTPLVTTISMEEFKTWSECVRMEEVRETLRHLVTIAENREAARYMATAAKVQLYIEETMEKLKKAVENQPCSRAVELASLPNAELRFVGRVDENERDATCDVTEAMNAEVNLIQFVEVDKVVGELVVSTGAAWDFVMRVHCFSHFRERVQQFPDKDEVMKAEFDQHDRLFRTFIRLYEANDEEKAREANAIVEA